MNLRSTPLCGLAIVCATAVLATSTLKAQPTIYADAVGDISTNIASGNPGGGTLDIVSMEVSDTTTDVIFNLTVNGNISTTDWGNFMVGIATGALTNTNTGNGWNRPINLNGTNGGMSRWVGSWVNSGGGSQLWTYTGSGTNGGTSNNWSGPAGLVSYSFGTNTNGTSTISYTVSKASLGVTNGDTISFDAYSSGSGGGDTAIDALANPNVSVSTWSQAYTSGGTNPINTYTLANSASLITNTVTFSVDMNVQIATSQFFPGLSTASVAGSYNSWTSGVDVLTDTNDDGIYEGTFPVVAPSGSSVAYKFYIDAAAESGANRTFPAGTNPAPDPLILPTVFYANNPGFRDVTFSVDMTIQEALGNYNGTNDVLVSGAFNNWDTSGTSNNVLTPDTNGVFTGTIPNIGGAEGANVAYKFYSPGMPNGGYESIDNRQLTLGPIGTNQVLPTVFWNNQTNLPQTRPVSFSVDMSVQAALGNFDTNTGTVRVIGNFNGQNYETGNTNYNLTNAGGSIYTGVFTITGDTGTTNQYKFYTPDTPPMPNNGYEIVNPNDLFENRTWVLGATNVQQDLALVFWSNDDGGATFTSWAQGAPLNPENLALYAIGGASSPTATNGIAPVTTLTTNALSITAIVRTNNPELTVFGESTTDLALGPWSTNNVTVTNAVDQSGVPFGTARQIFSVPRTTTNQFLRLKATLAP